MGACDWFLQQKSFPLLVVLYLVSGITLIGIRPCSMMRELYKFSRAVVGLSFLNLIFSRTDIFVLREALFDDNTRAVYDGSVTGPDSLQLPDKDDGTNPFSQLRSRASAASSAALSGSHPKAPGFAGGYLPCSDKEIHCPGLKFIWGEHCSECAMPTCYGTCAFYTPRRDLKCRRFDKGIEAVRARGAPGELGLRVSFRKWGKLEAEMRPGVVSRERELALHLGETVVNEFLAAAPLTHRLHDGLAIA